MENASKALIIAGAILISIVLVSVGVLVVNQLDPSNATQSMDDNAKKAFNKAYEDAAGTSVRGTIVKQLISTIITNNKDNGSGSGSSADHPVKVDSTITTASFTDKTDSSNLSTLRNNINNTKNYKVTLSYDDTGIVNKVTIAP